jgi:hypothetical protein
LLVPNLSRFSCADLTFEIGHICPDIGVQCVHHHLAICRAGNLDAPVNQAGRWGCTLPCVVLADVLGLWKEVKKVALVELGLSDHASLEKSFPALVECAVQKGKENSSIFAKNVTVLVVELTEDVDLAENSVGISCHYEVGVRSYTIGRSLKVQEVKDAMRYGRGEGRGGSRYYNSYKRHPYSKWAEDLLCLPTDVG